MMRSLHQVNRLTKGGSVFFEKQRKGFSVFYDSPISNFLFTHFLMCFQPTTK